MNALNDWYYSRTGIRPSDDDATMTEAELLALCHLIADENDPPPGLFGFLAARASATLDSIK